MIDLNGVKILVITLFIVIVFDSDLIKDWILLITLFIVIVFDSDLINVWILGET